MKLYDLDTEERYLSACMVDPKAIDTSPALSENFYRGRHKVIYAAMVGLHVRGCGVDPTSLRIELARLGQLEKIGGDEYLLHLMGRVESNPRACVTRIRELSSLRNARGHALAAVQHIEAENRPDAKYELELAQAETVVHGGDITYLRDAAAAAIEETKRKANGHTCVPTGIEELDRAIVGMEYGDLVILGGGTSTGKSTRALEIALHVDRLGIQCGIVSCEDAAARLGRRVLAKLSGLPAVSLRRGGLTPFQAQKIGGVIDVILGTKIHVVYRIGEPPDRVVDAVAMLKRRGCRLIIVDYAQAVVKEGQDTRDTMRDLCTQGKRECNAGGDPAVFMLLSQLKRPGQGAGRKSLEEMPTRIDLAESGYLEQKADLILLLWRDDEGRYWIVLDKGKDDTTGVTVELTSGHTAYREAA